MALRQTRGSSILLASVGFQAKGVKVRLFGFWQSFREVALYVSLRLSASFPSNHRRLSDSTHACRIPPLLSLSLSE